MIQSNGEKAALFKRKGQSSQVYHQAEEKKCECFSTTESNETGTRSLLLPRQSKADHIKQVETEACSLSFKKRRKKFIQGIKKSYLTNYIVGKIKTLIIHNLVINKNKLFLSRIHRFAEKFKLAKRSIKKKDVIESREERVVKSLQGKISLLTVSRCSSVKKQSLLANSKKNKNSLAHKRLPQLQITKQSMIKLDKSLWNSFKQLQSLNQEENEYTF